MCLIDADERNVDIFPKECEREYKDCDYTCSFVRPIKKTPNLDGWVSVYLTTNYTYWMTPSPSKEEE